jgi:NAD dependent epimerase/dehydratase
LTSFARRHVLVTGAGGFIGSHLVEELVHAGARVRALVRYTSRGDRGQLDLIDREALDAVEVQLGDLRDVESVRAAVEGTEIVFNLGAQIAIPYSYVNPRDFFETNVLGAVNVAQAARDHGVSRVVHVSTSEVYGTAQVVPITEDHPIVGQSPYSASKIGADKVMEAWHRSYEVPVVIVRPFNTFGPRQSARAVIPTIISQALAGDVLRLGSLDPRRDLTYVGDTVEGFLAAARSDAAVGRTVQLGTGYDVTVGEIVELVGDIVGRQLTVELDAQRVRPAASEVMRLISDPSLAKELMGWEPAVGLRAGLERTVEWIAANQDRFRVGEYTI